MFDSTGEGRGEVLPKPARVPITMKLAGFFLLLAGGGLVLAAVALLATPLSRTIFVLAGAGVEALGMVLVARAHLPKHGDRE
jgi:Flp pilus assembly protein TadB